MWSLSRLSSDMTFLYTVELLISSLILSWVIMRVQCTCWQCLLVLIIFHVSPPTSPRVSSPHPVICPHQHLTGTEHRTDNNPANWLRSMKGPTDWINLHNGTLHGSQNILNCVLSGWLVGWPGSLSDVSTARSSNYWSDCDLSSSQNNKTTPVTLLTIHAAKSA